MTGRSRVASSDAVYRQHIEQFTPKKDRVNKEQPEEELEAPFNIEEELSADDLRRAEEKRRRELSASESKETGLMSAKDYFKTSILATDDDVAEQKKRDHEALKLLEADSKKKEQPSKQQKETGPEPQAPTRTEKKDKPRPHAAEPPQSFVIAQSADGGKPPLDSEQPAPAKSILKQASSSQKAEEKDRDGKRGVKFDESVKKKDAPPKDEHEEPPKRASLFKQRMLGSN